MPVSIGLDEVTSGTAGPNDFAIVPGDNGCYNDVLSADGGTCTVLVAMTPGLNAASGPVQQTLSFQADTLSGQDVPLTVPLSGTVLSTTELVSWGYCVGENAGGAYGIVNQAYTVCLLENRDSPTSGDIVAFSNSGIGIAPANSAAQAIESVDNDLNTGLVSGSLAMYAAAFQEPATESLNQSYATASASAGAGIGQILSVGGQVTLLQSADQNITGFMFGYNVGVCLGCLPSPVSLQISGGTATLTDQALRFAIEPNPVESLEQGLLIQCVAADLAACPLAAAPVLAPAAAAWISAPYTGASAVAGETNFDYWAQAAGVQAATASGSATTVTATCPSQTQADCSGTVTLEAQETTGGSIVAARSAHHAKAKATRLLILGRAHFRIRAGGRQRVHIHLTKAGRQLLIETRS